MKLRADSFAARLSPAQRDELFALLAGGKSLAEAAAQAHAWTKAEWGGKAPSTQAVSAWFAGERVARRLHIAREVAIQTEANCPADYDEQTRRALGQAKFLAMLEELSPKEVAIFDRNELLRQKVELDKQKLAQDARVARRDLALERARLLLTRVKGGEKGGDLQAQIDLALEEIERMKRGEEAGA